MRCCPYGMPPALLAALHSVNPLTTPNLTTSLSVLQRQHAVNDLFMDKHESRGG